MHRFLCKRAYGYVHRKNKYREINGMKSDLAEISGGFQEVEKENCSIRTEFETGDSTGKHVHNRVGRGLPTPGVVFQRRGCTRAQVSVHWSLYFTPEESGEGFQGNAMSDLVRCVAGGFEDPLVALAQGVGRKAPFDEIADHKPLEQKGHIRTEVRCKVIFPTWRAPVRMVIFRFSSYPARTGEIVRSLYTSFNQTFPEDHSVFYYAIPE
jgi:hypothetical protein